MNWLHYDSSLSLFIRRIGNLILLNICHILCCLPVVTIGVSTAALYAACMCDDESTWPVAEYFKALKSNFRKATLLWLIILVPIVFLAVSFYLAGTLRIPGFQIIQLILLVLALVLLSTLSFLFALQARYENTVKQTLRNALVFGLCAIIPGLLMQVLALLPVIIFYLDLNLFVYLFAFWSVIGFSGTVKINSKVCLIIFNRLVPNNQ